MSDQDLFGLRDEPASELDASSSGVATKAQASPTVLNLDAWALRRGKDLIEQDEWKHVAGGDPNVAADMFGAAFEMSPTLTDCCTDALRRQFIADLLDTPDYRSLHEATMLDVAASELAGLQFAAAYAKLVEEKQQRGDRDEGGEGGGPASFRDEMLTIKAVGNAVREAAREVRELQDAREAYGWGTGRGDGQQLDQAKLAALFKATRQNPKLRRIVELAGRYRRLAQARQRTKTQHGSDDVVGIELAGDVSRLIPSELAKLKTAARLDTLRRIAERSAMCRELQACQPLAKGPIIVFVDESGSMSGGREENAKAICLAFAWIARKQKRQLALAAFADLPDDLRVLVISPNKPCGDDELIRWMCAFKSGGTTFDFLDLNRMRRIMEATKSPVGKTDVVLITDGQCPMGSQVIEGFRTWKAETQARAIAIVVQCVAGHELREAFDEVYESGPLSVTSTAVEEAFSI